MSGNAQVFNNIFSNQRVKLIFRKLDNKSTNVNVVTCHKLSEVCTHTRTPPKIFMKLLCISIKDKLLHFTTK